MNLVKRLVIIGALLAAPAARISAQIVERPVPFDSAGLVTVMTPFLAEKAALRPRTAAEAEDGVARFGAQASANAPRFLIDASHPQLYGGTGVTGDWSLGRSIAERFPILLAGGLTPDNVGDAIRAARPWGVDVASGVERSPGVKDEGKVQAFVQAAHATTVT